MKEDVIVAEAPVIIGEMTLTLLCRRSVTWFEIKGVLSFTAIKKPVYAVLSYAGYGRVLDMLGQEVPIRQVKLEYPGLDAVPGGATFPP